MAKRRTIFLILLLAGLFGILVWGFVTDSDANLLTVIVENMHSVWKLLISLVPKLVFLFFLYLVFRIIFFFLFELIVKRLLIFDYNKKEMTSITRVLKVVYWTAFFLMSFSLLFGNIGALFTSIGLIGFGITFALQKPILNLVGWLTILWKGIYDIGDRIKVQEVRGDVVEIHIMNTVVNALLPNSDLPSGKVVTLPNELVLTTDVENYTKDSNYIVDELSIAITYETDFKKAEKILHDIAWKLTKDNRKELKKFVKMEQDTIEKELLKLARVAKQGKRRDKKSAKQEIEKLQAEKEELEKEDEFYKEFQPKIRLELRNSSIELICQFITQYDKIKANRTRINEEFLLASKKEKDIEIAYPHMQLVTHGKTGNKAELKVKK